MNKLILLCAVVVAVACLSLAATPDELNRAMALRLTWESGADSDSTQVLAVKAAIARLKKSAATNQDIADILLLLKALNSQIQ